MNSSKENNIMKNRKEQKILGVTIDNKLTFKSHIKSLFKKVSQEIGALSRLSNHIFLIL